MPFCGKESVCTRCGGVLGCASESPQMGTVGAALGLAVTGSGATAAAANQSGNTADNIQSARFSETSRGPLVDLAEVRRIIESSDRTPENNQQLMVYIIDNCPDKGVKEWLKEYFNHFNIFPLLDIYCFLLRELKKKKDINGTEIDIIFVAHGEIDLPTHPANYLMPLSSITDVVLYSPWNCAIDGDVAYGVATGSIQPHHRVFGCIPPQPRQPQPPCPYPDYLHQPTNLPNHWNSMRKAGRSMIPNIFLSPLKDPEEEPEIPGEKPGDPAWNSVLFLQDELGEPGRNRVLIPLTRQGWMGQKIPFGLFTLVLSALLKVYKCSATVHLAACLGRSEDLNEAELQQQYGYTMDNTMMGSSEERIQLAKRKHKVHNALHKFFKDMFG